MPLALHPQVPVILALLVPRLALLFPVAESWDVLDLLLIVLFPEALCTVGFPLFLPQPSVLVLLCISSLTLTTVCSYCICFLVYLLQH